MSTEPDQRSNQKARTREAILEGARRLMARGVPVTVTSASEEMGISKATAYRYFSDPRVLASEAGLDIEVLPYDQVVAGQAGPRDKVVAVSLYFYDLTVTQEPAFRQYLARTLDAWGAEGAVARRGGRRLKMFEQALAEASLTPAARRRLVLALGTGTGIEALIALHDIAGAGPDEARQAVRDIAEALLDRFLG